MLYLKVEVLTEFTANKPIQFSSRVSAQRIVTGATIPHRVSYKPVAVNWPKITNINHLKNAKTR